MPNLTSEGIISEGEKLYEKLKGKGKEQIKVEKDTIRDVLINIIALYGRTKSSEIFKLFRRIINDTEINVQLLIGTNEEVEKRQKLIEIINP